MIIAAVCFGLATGLTAVPQIFDYRNHVMMASILWLAIGVWQGGFDLSQTSDADRPRLLPTLGTGTITGFLSPDRMIRFPLVLPEIMDITTNQMPGFRIIALVTFCARLAGTGRIIACGPVAGSEPPCWICVLLGKQTLGLPADPDP